MLAMTTGASANTSGVKDIAESIGGGINEGSLVLIEGGARAGKSVLSQHMAYGVLCSKESSVAYYTMDESVEELIAQMDSMALDTKHDFVTDRLRIYSIEMDEIGIMQNAEESLQSVISHISGLPYRFKLIVIDSVSSLMTHVNPTVKFDFLQSCKQLCDNERSIVLALDSHVFDGKMLFRAYAISDYYLKLDSKDMLLDTGQVDNRVVKILEVKKLAGVERPSRDGIKFEIKPDVGIQILPFVKIKV
ncbi:ATPase domain-containing protein [Chloroflexota bacterium]